MAWDTDVPLHEPQFIPSAPARLQLTVADPYWELIESLPLQVCKALPLRDLHTLSITCIVAPWSATDWVDVCRHCPKVAHLRVRSELAFTLAPTLEERNTFPSLITLALQDIASPSITLSSEKKKALGVVLPVILRARRKAGNLVRLVHFKSDS
jgi:hypothetical protein